LKSRVEGLVGSGLRACRESRVRNHDSKYTVLGSGFEVQGSGCSVKCSGFRVEDSGLGSSIRDSGFKVESARIRLQGSGSRL